MARNLIDFNCYEAKLFLSIYTFLVKISFSYVHDCCCCVTLVMSNSMWPHRRQPTKLPIPGILQARTLEWVAISFSNAWKWKVKVKSLSHVQLSDPMDCSLTGSSVHGIFQARILEWVAITFSNAWKWKVKVKSLSCVQLFTTPWTVAYRLLRPWDFPGKSTWVGCHCLLRCSWLFSLKFHLYKNDALKSYNVFTLE